jgi:hypothetical protein
LITAYAFLIWVGKFGLFLPGNLGMLNAGTRLPHHGPTGRVDHGVTTAVVVIVAAAGLLSGLKPTTPSIVPLAAGSDVLSTTGGWGAADTVELDSLHAYFGADARWTRTSLQGFSGKSITAFGLAQAYLDRVDAPQDALVAFEPSTTFNLGSFTPTLSRKIDLGSGRFGIQETFYDEASRSVWTVASVLVKDRSGTHRLIVSATSADDVAVAPAPGLAAFANLTVRTPRSSTITAAEWKDEKSLVTSNALVSLFQGYVNKLEKDALTGAGTTATSEATGTDPFVSDVAPDELVTDELVTTDGFVQ